jgi:mRNA-degrading endonuclease YafQ of YafQ-DinJ toxin-antitoxin module
MREIIYSKDYKKDIKKARKQGRDETELDNVIGKLNLLNLLRLSSHSEIF